MGHGPWATLPLAAIANNDLSALIDHERLLAKDSALTFYTDGSGIDGHIEAAEVNLEIGATRRRYLGKVPDYTVYSAELMGIILAPEIAVDEQDNYPSLPVSRFADNQSAFKYQGPPSQACVSSY